MSEFLHERKVLLALFGSLAFMALVYLFVTENYETSDDTMAASLEPIIRDGERITRRPDGTMKTRIFFDQGIKQGDAFLYYDDGQTVMLKMQYVNGKRNGTSTKYYKTGKVYAETSYKDNKLHGVRKLYYRNGKVKAEINYAYGYPGTGLKEYLPSGSPNEVPEFGYSISGDNLQLIPSTECKKEIAFFVGDLIEGQFLNDRDRYLKPIPPKDGKVFLNLKEFTPSFLKMQDVICSCKTKQGNPLVQRRRIVVE